MKLWSPIFLLIFILLPIFAQSSCGNGIVEATELCDDGNLVNSDGCSSECTIESGWKCNDAAPSECHPESNMTISVTHPAILTGIILAGCCCIFVLFCLAFAAYRWSVRRSAEGLSLEAEYPVASASELKPESPQGVAFLAAAHEEDYDNLLGLLSVPEMDPSAASSVLDFHDIQVQRSVALANIGKVYLARWKDTPVVLKHFCGPSVTQQDIHEFKRQATVLRHLQPHRNVVQFLGITIAPQPLTLVFEQCAQGPLFEYLRANTEIPETLKRRWMSEVSHGLLHLHYQGIIHRNLATHNVMLTSDLTTKLGGFGVCQVLTRSDRVQNAAVRANALKWMAPESLTYHTYSFQTDIWSLGVLFWEILAQAEPWPQFLGIQVAVSVAFENLTLEIPSHTPTDIRNLLIACWQIEPEARPTVEDVCITLGTPVSEMPPRPTRLRGRVSPTLIKSLALLQEQAKKQEQEELETETDEKAETTPPQLPTPRGQLSRVASILSFLLPGTSPRGSKTPRGNPSDTPRRKTPSETPRGKTPRTNPTGDLQRLPTPRSDTPVDIKTPRKLQAAPTSPRRSVGNLLNRISNEGIVSTILTKTRPSRGPSLLSKSPQSDSESDSSDSPATPLSARLDSSEVPFSDDTLIKLNRFALTNLDVLIDEVSLNNSQNRLFSKESNAIFSEEPNAIFSEESNAIFSEEPNAIFSEESNAIESQKNVIEETVVNKNVQSFNTMNEKNHTEAQIITNSKQNVNNFLDLEANPPEIENLPPPPPLPVPLPNQNKSYQLSPPPPIPLPSPRVEHESDSKNRFSVSQAAEMNKNNEQSRNFGLRPAKINDKEQDPNFKINLRPTELIQQPVLEEDLEINLNHAEMNKKAVFELNTDKTDFRKNLKKGARTPPLGLSREDLSPQPDFRGLLKKGSTEPKAISPNLLKPAPVVKPKSDAPALLAPLNQDQKPSANVSPKTDSNAGPILKKLPIVPPIKKTTSAVKPVTPKTPNLPSALQKSDSTLPSPLEMKEAKVHKPVQQGGARPRSSFVPKNIKAVIAKHEASVLPSNWGIYESAQGTVFYLNHDTNEVSYRAPTKF